MNARRTSTQHFLAFDLGAESGRTILGTLDQDRLRLQELTRFANRMVNVLGSWHWDILRLYEELKRGLAVCAREATGAPASIGIDTWGVDFGLLSEDGKFVGLPFAYRDSRTDGMMDEFFKLVPRERVYQLTGIQTMQINTLYQLFAMSQHQSPVLRIAKKLLFVPDIFHYLLSGVITSEFSFATTSQLFNPVVMAWEAELFAAMGLSTSLMNEVVQSGTVIGSLTEAIAQETGLPQVPVIACATHDTGSAVAAVPAEGREWAYISSGTWSLIGVEINEPLLSEQAMHYNFTNEGGVGNTFRFLKNVMGLWLVQQCRESWAKEREYGYEDLTELATQALPFKSIIDPDDSSFLHPADMPEAIAAFCRKTGQTPPASPGEFVRCALESLALKYRFVLERLRRLYPHPINRLHVIGGGCQNATLCQWTADASGLPVYAGPVEATAIGNLLVQALALGAAESLDGIRRIVRESFQPIRYLPQPNAQWDRAYNLLEDLCA